MQPPDSPARFRPEPLRQYALLADGERGALVGPRGDIAFLCVPRWHDDAIFSALLGGEGAYAITPRDQHMVWSGHYEQDSLIWRSRWVIGTAITESREALAFPGDPDRVVLLRRVLATHEDARIRITLDLRAGFGQHTMVVDHAGRGTWEGRSGDLGFRWSGAPPGARVEDGRLVADLDLAEGESHDLVLEVERGSVTGYPPRPAELWEQTARAWHREGPDLSISVAPGESQHSWAVLRGLTSRHTGAMVAAATTSLPEHVDRGRNYDYRFAWIRDQSFAGQAAAATGAHDLLDSAVRFVTQRVLADGDQLKPAYTVDGGQVPDQRPLGLTGYPGAPVRIGNHVNSQFQLDAFGEALLLLAGAERAGRLDEDGRRAVGVLVDSVGSRQDVAGAGIWELDDRRWAHSRLICAAGLRAVAAPHLDASGTAGDQARAREQLAERLVSSADDCVHPSGRWQRSPDDAAVDTALLLPGLRGAVPPDDPRHVGTIQAVKEDLTDDGYVYRFRQHPDQPLNEAEGAFLLSGFHLSLSELQQGREIEAVRWFERSRGALGPPGLFAEEFDVVRRQLRGNLPQAFVHALLLETAFRLAQAGVPTEGFEARAR